jgi:HEAT repeat protein
LIRNGYPATDLLLTALDESTDGEVSDRILEVAAATGDERFFGPASVLCSHLSATTRALALSVLASTGISGATGHLVSGLDDPAEPVMIAAAAGLARLAYWPAATAVEPLLSHPSWDVRRQAAVTLLALDAPGAILLRSDATGVGPAAEMANQALELQAISRQEEAA